MAPQTQKFEYFFDLPPELRELILSYICVFPTDILVGGGADGRCVALSPGATGVTRHQHPHHHHTSTNQNHTDGDYAYDSDDEEEDYEDYADPPTNLFLASPILHRDAGDLYYTRNTFHLTFLTPFSSGRPRPRPRHNRQQNHQWGGNSTPGSISSSNNNNSSSSDPGTATVLRLLTHADTTAARRRIRSAVISIRRVGGAQVQDVLVPALTDMVLSGSLRRLRVDVVSATPTIVSAPGGQQNQNSWMAGNAALRALLVLLADPGLEQHHHRHHRHHHEGGGGGGGGGRGVGLRVSRERHAAFWCPFHEQPSGGVEGLRESVRADVVCAVQAVRWPALLASVASVSPAAGAAAGAAAVGRAEGGVGEDGFLEVDIDRLVAAVCAGDAAEFNIKKVV